MELIKLWNAEVKKAYELQMSFGANENGFENPCVGMDELMFAQYVELCRLHSLGKNLREGRVPDTKYILVDDEGFYVGLFNLRHYLNDALRTGAGHIGYGIKKEFRDKGYATAGLSLVLAKARELGIDVAYLSCHKDNPKSLAVQKKNGGFVDHEDENEYYVHIPL